MRRFLVTLYTFVFVIVCSPVAVRIVIPTSLLERSLPFSLCLGCEVSTVICWPVCNVATLLQLRQTSGDVWAGSACPRITRQTTAPSILRAFILKLYSVLFGVT